MDELLARYVRIVWRENGKYNLKFKNSPKFSGLRSVGCYDSRDAAIQAARDILRRSDWDSSEKLERLCRKNRQINLEKKRKKASVCPPCGRHKTRKDIVDLTTECGEDDVSFSFGQCSPLRISTDVID